jgi:hypothetical protein
MAKDIMKTQACITGIITADENDVKQLQLHTHKVQAKSTCKFGAHDKRLACLGIDKYSGKKCENDREKICRKQFLLGGGCLRARAKW